MIPLSIGYIAKVMHGVLVSDDPAISNKIVDGLSTTDSREIEPGMIFFAKRGENTHGHYFLPQAQQAGAALAVVESEQDVSLPQIVVPDVVEALAELAKEVITTVRKEFPLRIVGITGSNGKTTTKNLLRDMCASAANVVAARKSYNNEVGAPTTMLEVAGDVDILIAEMGASAIGDIAHLMRLAPVDIGVVLNIGLAHVGMFGSIENTFTAKKEMVVGLQPENIAILNADDPLVASMAGHTQAKVVFFGLSEAADVRAIDVISDENGSTFTLQIPNHAPTRIHCPILGEHHVMNVLAAAACAHALNIPHHEICQAISVFSRSEQGRMEVVVQTDNMLVINDAYNASPDSMAAALRTLARIKKSPGRTVAVVGHMSELGDEEGVEHDRIGLLAVRLGIDQFIVVGEKAKRMYFSAIAEGSWGGQALFYETIDEAYEYLVQELRNGDTAVLKSSHVAGLHLLGQRLGEFFA